jgi:hypothetical protein
MGWGFTDCTGVFVTLEAAVATSIDARISTRILRKITVAAPPDAAGLPIVGNRKRYRGVRPGLPASPMIRNGFANVQIRKHGCEVIAERLAQRRQNFLTRPNSERACLIGNVSSSSVAGSTTYVIPL